MTQSGCTLTTTSVFFFPENGCSARLIGSRITWASSSSCDAGAGTINGDVIRWDNGNTWERRPPGAISSSGTELRRRASYISDFFGMLQNSLIPLLPHCSPTGARIGRIWGALGSSPVAARGDSRFPLPPPPSHHRTAPLPGDGARRSAAPTDPSPMLPDLCALSLPPSLALTCASCCGITSLQNTSP